MEEKVTFFSLLYSFFNLFMYFCRQMYLQNALRILNICFFRNLCATDFVQMQIIHKINNK